MFDYGVQDEKADIYSLGVLIQWLLTGEYPYELITEEGQMQIESNLLNVDDLLDKKIPIKLCELLLGMMNPNPV